MSLVHEYEILRQKLETATMKHRGGDLAGAAAICRDVLHQKPDQPDALHMMGVIAQQMGKTSLALHLFEETLKVVPHFGQALVNRATLLHALDRDEEALESARHAVEVEPNLADAWDIAGLLLRYKREYEASLAHHRRAVALKPDHPGFQSNYANILAVRGCFEEAYQAAQKAVRLDPQQARRLITLAEAVSGAGYPERALAYYQGAQKRDPDLTAAFVNEGRTALLIGEMTRGWALLEKRPLQTYAPESLKKLPRWTGEKVDHLLLVSEQGAGDSLQFMRYIPLIRDQVGQLTFQVQASLQHLVQVAFPGINVVTPDDPLPQVDAFEPLLSLPYRCETRLETIPADVPYLRVDEAWRSPWQERLALVKRPRIGLVWAGNPFHLNDHNRSLAFEEVEPLFSSAPAHFVSLQKGPLQRDLSKTGVFDAAPWLDDFTATAGLMVELDLLITVDTSPVHLAGALAKPMWMLTPFSPDWRWMLGREDSPWYPTLRLFRQTMPRDWSTVIDRIKKELETFIQGDRAGLKPQPWKGPLLKQNPYARILPD